MAAMTRNAMKKVEGFLQMGTVEAIQQFLQHTGRDLQADEPSVAFAAALRAGNLEAMNYLERELDVDCGFSSADSADERARIVALSAKEVKAMIEYEAKYENDATFVFPLVYYLENAVDAFIQYMRMLDARGRMYAMANLPGFIALPANFDINHRIIKSYIAEFPYDDAAKEIRAGGADALTQMLYPNPSSDYSKSRGELYQAEQRLQYYDRNVNGEPMATPEDVALLKAHVEQLKQQQKH